MDITVDTKSIAVLISDSTGSHICMQRIRELYTLIIDNINGFKVWYNPQDGQVTARDKNKNQIDKERDERVRDCRIYLCCLTDGFSRSEAIQELSIAKIIPGKYIIFVKIEEGNYGGFVEDMLKSSDHIYKYNDQQNIVNTIKGMLKLPRGKKIVRTIDENNQCYVDRGCESTLPHDNVNIYGCVKALKKHLERKINDEAYLKNENDVLKDEIEKLKAELNESNNYIYEMRKINNELKLENENLNSKDEINTLHSQITSLRAEVAKYKRLKTNNDVQQLEKEINRLRRYLYKKELDNSQLISKTKTLEAKITTLEHKSMKTQLKKPNSNHQFVVRNNSLIFLLYSETDAENKDIQQLKNALKERFSNICDRYDIKYGPNQIENIGRQIERSSIVICGLTKAFIGCSDTMQMLRFSKESKKLLLPIQIENIRMNSHEDLQVLFNNNMPFDAFKNRTSSAPLRNLWRGDNFDKFMSEIEGHLDSLL